jgi:predicted O-methyltransferase YrrM
MLASPPSSSAPNMFGAIGGLMGVGTQMMAAGLSMGQIQTVARETLNFARENAGEDAVGEIVGAIPGLGQLA